MTLFDSILARHDEDPHATAISIFPEEGGVRRISFGEWWELSRGIADHIPEPTHQFSFIAFQSGSGCDVLIALLAAWMRGIALFPLSKNLTDWELSAILRQSGPPLALWKELPRGGASARRFPSPSADSPALLLHTSGTTADPKVFGFRHAELLASAEIEAANAAIQPQRVLNLRPKHTSGGLNTLWPGILRGHEFCFAQGLHELPRPEALRELDTYLHPDLYVASPAYLRSLLASLDERENLFGPHERPRSLYYGGSCLSDAEHARLTKLGLAPSMRYGMTECAHILSLRDMSDRRKHDSKDVGRPFPEVEIRLHSGKLEFRSPGFASIRFQNGNPEPCLMDGWYASDDSGSLQGGTLLLEGRGSEIVVAGFRVSAAEIESLILGSGFVVDCVALGCEDPLFGQRVIVLAVPKSGADRPPHELMNLCRTHLSEHKVPKKLIFVDAIPSVANGKRHWRRIRELAQSKGTEYSLP